MSPIPLGILAASGALAAGSFELLESVTVPGEPSEINFINLNTYSADYKHLQIRGLTTSPGSAVDMRLNFNDDSITRFYANRMYGNGSSVIPDFLQSNYIRIGNLENQTQEGATAFVIDFVNCFNTDTHKIVKSRSGRGGANVWFTGGSWGQTAAINKIKLYVNPSAGRFRQSSKIALYGIRG